MFNRKLLVVGAIILVPVLLIVLRFGAGGWNSQSLTVSPQTTFIEGPLRPDGYPDYLGALNAELSEGVTPENNAAVLILRATGPKEIPQELRGEFFSQLRMSPISESGDYFVPWSDYFRTIPKAEWPQPPANSDLDAESFLLELYEPAMTRPWSREEFPLVGKWVDANQGPLEVVVAASKLPRYYAPRVASGQPPMLVNGLLPLVDGMRGTAHGLAARAMLRLNEKDYPGVWNDLTALRRLGRIMGNEATLVEILVGYAVEGLGVAGQIEFLAVAELTPEQWAVLQNEIDALPPRSRVSKTLDRGERLMVLDAILGVAEGGAEALPMSGLANDSANSTLMNLALRGVDWNVPLAIANEWMDRLVAAGEIEDPKQRAVETARVEADMHAMVAGTNEPWSLVGAIASRRRASEKIGDIFVALMMPAISAMFQAEARTETNDDLLVIGLALARYKAEQGAYPEKLEQLAPDMIQVVPTDAFAGAPFVYKKRGEGYLLYSLGANQTDDGGKGADQEGDDLVIEIPRPTKMQQAEKEALIDLDDADAPPASDEP
ncbi:MAG: hypothetical protein WD894_05840 [Pirellulales bacterium]